MPTVSLEFKLRAAVESRALVRVTRKVEDGSVDGFVVGTGKQWALMLVLGSGIDYAGFQAFRRRDIKSIELHRRVPSSTAPSCASVRLGVHQFRGSR
jgi:hypothetical protein